MSIADPRTATPDSSAVRVALWRALHVEHDPPPHVLEDVMGLTLAAPDDGWRHRPDMNPEMTSRARASIIARARFIEDLVVEQQRQGVAQYVILGAVLDSFAQRRPELGSRLKIFEIDQPGPQAWKRQRLIETGLGIPEWLRLVPVDFEAGEPWWERLAAAGFDTRRPAIVAAAGLTMYISRDANAALLRQIASLAAGSTLVATFMPPADRLEAEERPLREATERGARASGTPMVSFFTPEEITAFGLACGFKTARYVSTADLTRRYFSGRTDGLRPSGSEELLVATT